MMSLKQWCVVMTIFLSYLSLGAVIFLYIEGTNEAMRKRAAEKELHEFSELFHAHLVPRGIDSQGRQELFVQLSNFCGKSVDVNLTDFREPFEWDYYTAFFFAFTTVSTIGYGDLIPTDTFGRIFCILFALIGIPLKGIILANLADVYSSKLIRVHHRYKEHVYESRTALFGQILMYLVPGFCVFIFLPAGVFVFFEGWAFDEAVYYSFVTLATIGFGDYVAGQNVNDYGMWTWFYKIFILLWILFGLGYLVMILSFITSAMRSKHILMIEKVMARHLKETQTKLLRNFAKEAGYMRRLVNEMYLNKIKPVYGTKLPLSRTGSLPCLSSEDENELESADPMEAVQRPRSHSAKFLERPLARVKSDSDLRRIDRRATFAAVAVDPTELLAHFVGVLSGESTKNLFDEVAASFLTEDEEDEEVFRDVAKLFSSDVEEDDEDHDRRRRRKRKRSKVRTDKASTESDKFQSTEELLNRRKSSPALTRLGQEAGNLYRQLRRASGNLFRRQESSRSTPLHSPKGPASVASSRKGSPKFIARKMRSKSVCSSRKQSGVSFKDDQTLPEIKSKHWMFPKELRKRLSLESSSYAGATRCRKRSAVDVQYALEDTSLADFLKALGALHYKVSNESLATSDDSSSMSNTEVQTSPEGSVVLRRRARVADSPQGGLRRRRTLFAQRRPSSMSPHVRQRLWPRSPSHSRHDSGSYRSGDESDNLSDVVVVKL